MVTKNGEKITEEISGPALKAVVDGQKEIASNVNSGIRLKNYLISKEISGGHGFEKHVIEQREFVDLGISTREHYASHIERVLNNPSDIRYTTDGRVFYVHEKTKTIVVRNPKVIDGGTAFRPADWNEYISKLPPRKEP